MDKEKIVSWLKRQDFDEIANMADQIRKETMGDEVHLRAIIEFSNYCQRRCRYCGLNAENHQLTRARMSEREILSTAWEAAEAGYKTIILQSGEDPFFTVEKLGNLTKIIKSYGVSVTLSCGEFSYEDLKYFREQGADRYLLKHETADAGLYASLHPCGNLKNRIRCLEDIRELGYETGSGFMIGLPGQTLEIIAEDLLLLKELQCKMAGIGPFIPHGKTSLKGHPSGSISLTKRAIAIARILIPDIHLPATTALGVLSPQSEGDVFLAGANVVMIKVTPDEYKSLYDIYPSPKTHTNILADRRAAEERIRMLGRKPL